MGRYSKLSKFRYAHVLAGAALCLLGCSASAFAASSDWFKTDGAKIRLISAPSPDGKTIQAGLQIELEKGWKTYWRSPGASGLPPQVNFSGSKNTAATQMSFPIPSTFGEKNNLTAGYLESVTFPIDVEPLYSGRPVTLNATGILGICGKVCVPVQFQLSVKENGQGMSTSDVASTILASRSKLVAAPDKDLKILSGQVVMAPKTALQVEAKIPLNTRSSTLFVEGPDNWYLTPVKATSIDGNFAKFTVPLDNLPKDADPSATSLRFTLVADGKGIEQQFMPKSGH